MSPADSANIPLFTPYGRGYVTAAEARRMANAPNVLIVRTRDQRTILRVQVLSAGDDYRRPSRHGNSQATSHDHETPHNPPRVWCLKEYAWP